MRTATQSAASELRERLQGRRAEIEEAVLTRTRAVADPAEVDDPEYTSGLSGAVRTAVGLAISVLEAGPGRAHTVPAELEAQARLAARNGVGVDTVLRRYLVGYTLLCDYLLWEAGALPAHTVRRALRAEGALLDRTLAAVVDAYALEMEQRHRSAERRRSEQVKGLLAGELPDGAELGYDLDFWHLGVLASGHGAAEALRELAAATDRRLLLVRPGGSEIWGWLGGDRRLGATELVRAARARSRPELALAIGEPGRGVAGWRLTHRQAKLALPVALRGEDAIVNYSDVALVASAMSDEVLTHSLTQFYLAPLETERDGGAALRETLRAYFAAGRSMASTAAVLGVSRQTVTKRICIAEERIGQPLATHAVEIETALRLLAVS